MLPESSSPDMKELKRMDVHSPYDGDNPNPYLISLVAAGLVWSSDGSKVVGGPSAVVLPRADLPRGQRPGATLCSV